MTTFLYVFMALVAASLVLRLSRVLTAPRIEFFESAAAETEVLFYREQLERIDQDVAEGLISQKDARIARQELERAFVDHLKERVDLPAVTPQQVRANRRLSRFLIVLVPLVSLAVYLHLGHPALNSSPFIFRMYRGEVPNIAVNRAALLNERYYRRRVEQNPHDAHALNKLAHILEELGRYEEAVTYFERTYRLVRGRIQEPIILGKLAENTVMHNGGIVTEEARVMFEDVLRLHPYSQKAVFFLALYKAQHGKEEQALKEWQNLIDTSPAYMPWLPMVQEHMKAAERRVDNKKNRKHEK